MNCAVVVTRHREDGYKILVEKPQRRRRLEDVILSRAIKHSEWFIYGKGKSHPITSHEAPMRARGIAVLFLLNSALDGR